MHMMFKYSFLQTKHWQYYVFSVLNWNYQYPVKSSTRNMAKTATCQQDPNDIKNMPIFQYATPETKRSIKVYTWGNATCGALGNPNFLRPKEHKKLLSTMHKPHRLSFAETHKVSDIACGYGFTVMVATSKNTEYKLFGTGLNTDSQIGYHCARKDHPLTILAQPVPIPLPLASSSTKVINVACGRAHTAILTDEGVFTLGNNAYGQCGRPIIESEIYKGNPRINKVEGIDEEINEIVCGQDHTMFLTKTGKVWSCGWGADGQTGIGNYANQGVPTKVKGDIEGENIVHLSGAADCVLAVSDKGDIFGWGNSEYGQLRLATSDEQINISKYIPLKNVGKVINVASGGTMCAVLNADGLVYVWGYGILGQGPEVSHLSQATLLPETLFGKNELNKSIEVTKISCSVSHFAAITNKGDLFMWGRNRKACLGFGHENDQYFPFRVSVPAEVLKISCGVDHTATLCRSFR